jgi:hypothetical protein
MQDDTQALVRHSQQLGGLCHAPAGVIQSLQNYLAFKSMDRNR